jgi:deazaflavin-dependent oxidoreductase (nitroreductase family)
MEEEYQELISRGFKAMNRYFMVPSFKLGLGKLINVWPDGVGRIMVLEHTGRKSGKTYHTPLNYEIVGQDVYCLAGFGKTADWYQNVMATPQVEIWLPDGWWCGIAEDATDDPNALAIYRKVLIASGFAAPAFEGVYPRQMSDEALADLVADYRLVRIRRVEARTGPGGPGEFAWVWPLAAMGLGAMLLLRPKRRG